MTYVCSQKNTSLLALLLVSLLGVLAVVVVWLVVLYNKTVTLEHTFSKTNLEFQKIGSENADLKDKTFALLNGDSFGQVARAQGLVTNKKPQYVQVEQWAFASR